MIKKIAIIVLLFFSIVIGLYYFVFRKKSTTVNLNQLKIKQVVSGKFYDLITVTGKVVPIRTIYLNAYEGGRVKELLVSEGTMLTKGQTIMQLENNDLQLKILNSEAALTEQSSRIRDIRLSMDKQSTAIKKELIELKYSILQNRRIYETNKQLFEKQYVSQHDLQTSKDQYNELVEKFALLQQQQAIDSSNRILQLQQMNESLILMQNNLNIVKQKLDYLTIKSPIDGTLTSILGEVGETKNQGSQLAVITVQTASKIHIDLEEKYIGTITPGMSAILFSHNKQYNVTVGRVSSQVVNGHFELDCRLGDVQPSYLPIGSTVTVSLELALPQTVTIIPRGDFISHTDGKWIFVIDQKKQRARRKNICLLRQNSDFYEVTSGLENNESILVDGYNRFSEYDELFIK